MSAKRYAPIKDGLKPWVRLSYHFGQTTESIVYAETSFEARHMYARMHLETVRVRRATDEDLARIEENQ